MFGENLEKEKIRNWFLINFAVEVERERRFRNEELIRKTNEVQRPTGAFSSGNDEESRTKSPSLPAEQNVGQYSCVNRQRTECRRTATDLYYSREENDRDRISPDWENVSDRDGENG